MDITALFKISYGLYILGAKDKDKGRFAGCIVNTVVQSTASPVTLTICVNKDNYTNAVIKKTNEFVISILSERANPEVFGIFGFNSSRDRDKFAEIPHALTASGLPYANEGVTGYIQCKVINFVDNYNHTLFIAEVVEAENISKEPPMTYAYYHTVVKGKTAKNAPTYVAEDKAAAGSDAAPSGAAANGASQDIAPQDGAPHNATVGVRIYKCAICGYEYVIKDDESGQLPDDFLCPICRAAKEKFSIAI